MFELYRNDNIKNYRIKNFIKSQSNEKVNYI